MPSDDDDASASDNEVFHGVNPLPRAKRKQAPVDSHSFFYAGRTAGASTSAFAAPVAAEELAAEEALMRSMGLPTAVRQGDASTNDDHYEVWAADPAHALLPNLHVSSEQQQQAPPGSSSGSSGSGTAGCGSAARRVRRRKAAQEAAPESCASARAVTAKGGEGEDEAVISRSIPRGVDGRDDGERAS